jgi:hypothetical protein
VGLPEWASVSGFDALEAGFEMRRYYVIGSEANGRWTAAPI